VQQVGVKFSVCYTIDLMEFIRFFYRCILKFDTILRCGDRVGPPL